MKEFEKWFESGEAKSAMEDIFIGYSIEEPFEVVWRAALEWVLSRYSEMDLEDWDYIACQIKEEIEGELEDV